jgi:serine/threonine-protein kinase
VWRGRDIVLAREVALKVLRETMFAGGGAKARFAEEVRHVGWLEHPSVVPVYDLGELPDGRPFFVMRLVHGPTLAEVLPARVTPAFVRNPGASCRREPSSTRRKASL